MTIHDALCHAWRIGGTSCQNTSPCSSSASSTELTSGAASTRKGGGGGGGGGGVTPVAGLLALRDLRLDARHQLVDLPKHIPPEFSSNFLEG